MKQSDGRTHPEVPSKAGPVHQNVDVSLFIPSLRGGGAERSTVMLANGFAARGMRVDLVLASAIGPYVNEVSNEVRIIDLKCKRTSTSLPALVRYLRRERPRAMLSALNYANIIAVLARRTAGVSTRLVVSERTTVSQAMMRARSFRQRAVFKLMRWAYIRADGIVAISRGVADDLATTVDIPRERIEVVYNPVVTSEMKWLAEAPVDHPWLEECGIPVILAVGRLSAVKDHQTLIDAFAQVSLRRDCRLVILGEGELRSALEDQVQELGLADYVDLPGFVENPFAWMSKASIFVSSSAWEGLSNVLIQAMACGVPVISTDCPSGPSEVLEAGRWGTLTSVGSSEELCNAIISCLDAPPKRGVAVERSELFNVSNSVDGYLRALFGVRGAYDGLQ